MNAFSRAGLLAITGVMMAAAFACAIDGDLYWQQALGESILHDRALPATLGPATFSVPNAPWFAHEWMFATCWAIAARMDAEPIFRVGCALLALATVAIDALRCRGAAPHARTIALTLVVIGVLPSFGLRAQIVAWPLLALVLLALERGRRASWWVVPIAVVWDNLHASGLIVPALVVIDGIGRAVSRPRTATIVSTATLALATVLAFVATPFGLAYAQFALAWSQNPATNLIVEWQPVRLATLPLATAAFAIVALLVVGELRRARLSWPQRLLAIALFAAALLHIRNIALFCIVAGPWTTAALESLLPRASTRRTPALLSDRGLVALAAVAAVCLAVAGAHLRRTDPQDPTTSVARLAAYHRPMRVACEDFSWCSRFAGSPNVRVFLDGRVDAYPDLVLSDYRRLLAGDSAAVVRRWNIDAVITRRDSPLARSLPAESWQRVHDGATQLFVRNNRDARRLGRRHSFFERDTYAKTEAVQSSRKKILITVTANLTDKRECCACRCH